MRVQDDYLLALVPQTDHLSVYGEARKSVVSKVPNPQNQPPRIYSLLATGGGVILNEDTALALKGAGFNVVPFDPRPEEFAWLVKLRPDFAKAGKLWAVSCDGKPVYTTNTGGRRCGAPPALVSIPEQEALTTGAATQADLQQALKYVVPQAVKGYVYYGTKPGMVPGVTTLERAIDSVRRLEGIAVKIPSIEATQRASGKPMLPSVENRIALATRTLAMFAQPTEELRKGYTTLRSALVAMKTPGVDKLPVDPFPKFGFEPTTSTLLLAGFIAVVAVSAAAAVYMLSSSWTQVVAAQSELDKAEAEQRQQLIDCIDDPTKTAAEKRHCKMAMRQMTVQSKERTDRGQDANPFSDMADALKYAVPLAAIGFTAIYFGPVIAEATGATAQRIEDWRQRRR